MGISLMNGRRENGKMQLQKKALKCNGVCDYLQVGMNPYFVGVLLLLEYDQTQIADMVLLHRQSSSISCLQKKYQQGTQAQSLTNAHG